MLHIHVEVKKIFSTFIKASFGLEEKAALVNPPPVSFCNGICLFQGQIDYHWALADCSVIYHHMHSFTDHW